MKKIETWLLSPASRYFTLNPQFFCQKIDKKHPLVKWTAKYVFFIEAAIKIAALVNWRTTPESLCESNDLQLETQKDVLILKMLLRILSFCF